MYGIWCHQTAISSLQPSVGKVECVERVAALVWPDRSNQSSVTLILVGSRRTPIERQRNKKKPKTHCHHVFSVQSLPRATQEATHKQKWFMSLIFLSSELRPWTQHCERIVNWHWGACIVNSTNKSDLDISIQTCMGPNKAESAERIKWEWIGPVYCEESNPTPPPPSMCCSQVVPWVWVSVGLSMCWGSEALSHGGLETGSL